MRFAAEAVAFGTDDETRTEVLVLAEHPGGDGRQLLVQRGLEDDEQDVALGMDRHCLVMDTGWVAYGAVTAWAVERGALRVELTEAAAADLGASAVVVGLPDDEAARVVADALPRLVGRDGPARA